MAFNPRGQDIIAAGHLTTARYGMASTSLTYAVLNRLTGKNINIDDQMPVFGVSMDFCGNAETGYVSRGERQLEPYMEC